MMLKYRHHPSNTGHIPTSLQQQNILEIKKKVYFSTILKLGSFTQHHTINFNKKIKSSQCQ
jgi:hypothetical protein